jgi:hypothetical protein
MKFPNSRSVTEYIKHTKIVVGGREHTLMANSIILIYQPRANACAPARGGIN